MVRSSTLALLVSALPSALATYQLSADYSGQAFFDSFDFFTGPDPTNGHVKYVSKDEANSSSLAGLMFGGNATGAIYLGVDSTTITPQGRPSIRAISSDTYNHALVIVDILHMPGGICGTWPAFWMLGSTSDWPYAGEIDIVEGANEQPVNVMTLHTDAGVVVGNCTANMAGTLVTPNCDANAPDQKRNAGCQVADHEYDVSFGSAFNENLGGVYAMEYTSQAIKIWFFPRGMTPEDVTAGTPDPSLWQLPNALFAGDDLDLDNHFDELQLIFDTTFCGDWAGKVWTTDSCASKANTCEDFVTNNPDAFADAYWAINSLKVYEDDVDSSNARSKPKVKKSLSWW